MVPILCKHYKRFGRRGGSPLVMEAKICRASAGVYAGIYGVLPNLKP